MDTRHTGTPLHGHQSIELEGGREFSKISKLPNIMLKFHVKAWVVLTLSV